MNRRCGGPTQGVAIGNRFEVSVHPITELNFGLTHTGLIQIAFIPQ